MLISFGILSSVEWYFLTDESDQAVGLIFKGQAVREDCLHVKFGTAGCPETSVRSYHSGLREVTKGRRPQVKSQLF